MCQPKPRGYVMKIIICNAFSLSMLDREQQYGRDYMDGVRVPRPLSDESLSAFCRLIRDGKAELVSAVGHADTAWLIANELGLPVTVNRVSVKLTNPDTRAIIAQYTGPRLPEGTKTLPECAKFEWWII